MSIFDQWDDMCHFHYRLALCEGDSRVVVIAIIGNGETCIAIRKTGPAFVALTKYLAIKSHEDEGVYAQIQRVTMDEIVGLLSEKALERLRKI